MRARCIEPTARAAIAETDRAGRRRSDVVLLAGKGHEDYQEIAGVKHAVLRRRRTPQRRAAQRRGGAHMSVMFTLAQALHWMPGAQLVGDGATPFDARPQRHPHAAAGRPVRRAQGRALRRPRFPGRSARPTAPSRRIAERGRLPAGLPGLEVADSKLALGALARRLARAASTLPLIAVTGSNGKTTVTQMIASILRAWQPARRRSPPQATSTTTSACR